MNPDRYAVIYNRKYDNDNSIFDSSMGTAAPAIPSSSSSAHISAFTKTYQNRYYNEYREGILEIANSFLKILLDQMVDNTMVVAMQQK